MRQEEAVALLSEPTWTGRVFLDGWVPGSEGDQPVMEPATGEELGRVGLASPGDAARAAARAAEAQVAWGGASYLDRSAVLRRAGDLWAQHAEEVQEWIVREAGSIAAKAALETDFASKICHEAAGLATRPYGDVLRTSEPRLSFARRVPVGVVAVISPFNYPLVLAIRAVAPALALGNAVVLKPDPRTPVSGGVALARVLEEAGLPPGLFAVLPGGADVGQALVCDPNVQMVCFTGSTAGGRAVATLAAQHMKRTHLELGGNSAMIVLDDADVGHAASLGSWGSFLHQGQICMATSRHLVQRGVVGEYVAALAEHADRLPVGNPAKEEVALGPMIDEKQRDRVHGLVTATVDAGASLAAGGTFEGLFYRPTVLSDVPTDAPAYVEEIFGPVAPVVPFDSPEEAVKLAADTPYGLSLGIVTRDVMRGLALADRIPSGLVHINDQTVNDEVVNPFGGVKWTGPGSRIGGPDINLEAFTSVQWVTMRSEPPEYPF